MELGGHDIVPADGRAELDAVVGGGRHHGRVFRLDVVGVDEVDVDAVLEAGKDRRPLAERPDDLIRMKRAAARPKDLEDLRVLLKLQEQRDV